MTILGKRKAEDELPPSHSTSDGEGENMETVVQDCAILESNPFLDSDMLSEPDLGEQPENDTSTATSITESNGTLATYIQEAKNLILDRISERALPNELSNLSEQYDKLLHLIDQTVKIGESNSCLLIGNRGSGKTALIRKVIQTLRKDHKDNFLTVELNGLIQTDDRSALREITRQLTRESQMEDRTFVSLCTLLYTIVSLPLTNRVSFCRHRLLNRYRFYCPC
jgi:hypothetical protein